MQDNMTVVVSTNIYAIRICVVIYFFLILEYNKIRKNPILCVSSNQYFVLKAIVKLLVCLREKKGSFSD